MTLKPCPFCGGEAEINQIGNGHTKSRGFEVKCLTWGCSTKKRAMVIRQPIEKAREFAIAAWNRRAPADAIISGPLQEQLRELAALRKFFGRLKEHFWTDERLEMDGADFQDWGVQTGVIRECRYDPARHGEFGADYYGLEPGDTWFEPVFPAEMSASSPAEGRAGKETRDEPLQFLSHKEGEGNV
jgi:Lar family restriction alleviation protein